MPSGWKLLSALCGIGLCACSTLVSQPDHHPATVKELVARFVAATNAQDFKRLNALLHPKSLACVTPENKDFYERALEVSVRQPIPANYTFSDTQVAPKDKLPMEGYAVFPVRPTDQLQIEYSNGVEDNGIVMFWLVRENGRWYKDDPCFAPEAIKQFHDDLPNIRAREEATRAQVAQIKEPLLAELNGLIREGKTATASRRYREATGRDGDTALMVIAELEEQMRRQR